MSSMKTRISGKAGRRSFAALALASAAVVLTLPGCRPGDDPTRVASWSLVDPSQRHPIMVSQQPTSITLKVARGAYGLSPHQRSQVISFLDRYRGGDAGNSRLIIEAPSGSANEVASMQAVAEIRALIAEAGFDPTGVMVEAVHGGGDAAPVRVSYLKYVAEGPECGRWPTNLAESDTNIVYPNLGCANQRNLAAMVANPADLLGPRSVTPGSRERRDVVWDKYVKGESTISNKQEDEKVKVKGAN